MVRIGVTGHRHLSELDKIGRAIESALDAITKQDPSKQILLLSSLAEGADRLVARYVLRRPHAKLIVVLPLESEEYLKDFSSDESKQEFVDLLVMASQVVSLPPADSREAAYDAAGEYVLGHCDLLLTIWDGRSAQGQGGTGEIVARARARKLPIAWIHAGNIKQNTETSTTLGNEQGRLDFENI